MSDFTTMSAVSTLGAAPTMEAAPKMGAASTIMGAASSMDAIAFLELEIFEGIPLWLFCLIISISLVLILLILMISWVLHAENEVKRKTHHRPTPDEVMIELQKELLRSMQSSSKQTWLQIGLTILFITISVLGGAVVLGFFENIRNFGATLLSQFIEVINYILTQ